MKKITALAAILAIPAMAAPAGYFQVPGTETTMKVYGKAETDAFYTLTKHRAKTSAVQVIDNDPDSPTYGTIILKPGKALGDQSTMEKGTVDSFTVARLGVTTTTPSAYGDVNVKIELQAKSTGIANAGSLNMRHAYGEFHGLLIGQTDSLFNAWHNVPGYWDTFTPDFNGTSRSRQIRYSFAPADGFKLGFAMEQDWTEGSSTKFGPAFVAAGTYSADWGAVTASVAHSKKRDWSKTGTNVTTNSGSATSFAVSGAWNITENDSVQAVYTHGILQHGPAFKDAWVEKDNGDYKAYLNTSYGLGYTHNWGNGFDSSIGFGQNIAPKKTIDGTEYSKTKMTELFVNTNWQVTKNVQWGIEYYQAVTKFKNDVVTKANGTLTDKYKDSSFNMHFLYNFF